MNWRNSSIFFSKLQVDGIEPVDIEILAGKDVEPVLKKGCAVLEELNCHYFLSAGTLLGFHRNNDFIQHDTDIDIGMICDAYNQDLLDAIIDKMPFKLFLVIKSGGYTQLAFVGEQNIVFDIYIYYKFGNQYINWTPEGIIIFPEDLLENLTTISFNGNDYPCADPDTYCVTRYGKDWRIPHSAKGKMSDDTFNLITPSQWKRKVKLYISILKLFFFGKRS